MPELDCVMGRRQRKRQQECLKREKDREKKREMTELAIRKHAEGLKEELNLRLFCQGVEDTKACQGCFMEDGILLELMRQAGNAVLWRELCTPENILWVDDVLITEISYYHAERKKEGKQRGFLVRLKSVFSYVITHLFFRRGHKEQNKKR